MIYLTNNSQWLTKLMNTLKAIVFKNLQKNIAPLLQPEKTIESKDKEGMKNLDEAFGFNKLFDEFTRGLDKHKLF